MYLSNFFSYQKKEVSQDAEIISHKLMLKAGMIEQLTSGIYSWLPLGLLVLRNIENIVREEHKKAGIAEILMPILQPASLWQESGRYQDYGKEMLRVQDRHKRDMLFGPTAEEAVTDIFRKHIQSYKDLPINLYQIQWKFRDEIRPRFGIMRGREFLMKDAYSFDLDQEAAEETYKKYYKLYLNIFKKLGVTAIPVKADNGEIGGDLSHEFHILADTGESIVYAEKGLFDKIDKNIYDFQELKDYYAVAGEKYDVKQAVSKDIVTKKGIEVGHIFNFGQKYSKAMNAKVLDQNGKNVFVNMGSYGIGVSRIVAAIIECFNDDKGIIWPKEVAPFQIIIIPLQMKDKDLCAKAEEIYKNLLAQNNNIALDDRKKSLGEKLASNDLIGIPTQIRLGSRNHKNGELEIKDRKTGKTDIVTYQNLEKYLKNII